MTNKTKCRRERKGKDERRKGRKKERQKERWKQKA